MPQEKNRASVSVKAALPTIVVARNEFVLTTIALHTSRCSVCRLASNIDMHMSQEIFPTNSCAPKARIVNRAIAYSFRVLPEAILHRTERI